LIPCTRFAAAALALAASLFCASAQVPVQRVASRRGPAQFVTLSGSVPPVAQPEFDQGPVAPATRMSRMVLVLKPTGAQQAALDTLLAAQQDPASPLYHRWLTPSEFGARFGAGGAAIAQITGWLAAQGFTTEEIPAGRRMIVFSGSAGQIAEIHRYHAQGAMHLANAQDPQIPASFSNIVDGILSLNDVRRTAQNRTRPLTARPQYSAGATHYLFPADFATIYNVVPLLTAGTNGSGVSIAIAARSNIHLDDVAQFRKMAGLPPNLPQVLLTGNDPGLVAADQQESTIDAEWSGALAPAASIKLVVAASSASTDGIDLASAWIVNHAAAPIVAVS
jgi:subtilase family serine protease